MGRRQISHTLDQTVVDRIDKLKIGLESRSSVIRRVIDAGLPIVERRQREMMSRE